MKATIRKKELIFREDTRPFNSCHASTVALCGSKPVVACFGGDHEGAGNVAIWTTARDGFGNWRIPVMAAGQQGIPHWNPALFTKNDGSLELYFKAGLKIPTWQTFRTRSSDGGVSWEKPLELVPGDRGGRGPVKNKLIRLSDGSLLAPASLELCTWRAFTDRSEDNGRTWTMSNFVYQSDEHRIFAENFDGGIENETDKYLHCGVIQPTLWESAPGRVHMLLRSTFGHIYRSDSEDYGRTWNPIAYESGLPNNNSGIDVTRHDSGALFLVYTPSSERQRTPLCLGMSTDNGTSWSIAATFECEPGEYSYPAVICDGNTLHVTYTHKRTNVCYCKVEVEA